MIKSHRLVKRRHKTVNIADKKSQTRVKYTQKCKFKWQKVITLSHKNSQTSHKSDKLVKKSDKGWWTSEKKWQKVRN